MNFKNTHAIHHVHHVKHDHGTQNIVNLNRIQPDEPPCRRLLKRKPRKNRKLSEDGCTCVQCGRAVRVQRGSQVGDGMRPDQRGREASRGSQAGGRRGSSFERHRRQRRKSKWRTEGKTEARVLAMLQALLTVYSAMQVSLLKRLCESRLVASYGR